MKNRFLKSFILVVCATLTIIAGSLTCFADSPTDEITNYEITVDIQDDGTALIRYEMDWLVLESDYIGAVSWVQIGMPNYHFEVQGALTDNITSVEKNGSYAMVYFDKSYYEGETIHFAFEVIQDYIYEMFTDGMGRVRYEFTPGWFDQIDIDKLVIKWNDYQVDQFEPSCLNKGGYLTWTKKISAGNTFTVSVTYPRSAFNFDETKFVDYTKGEDWGGSDDDWNSDGLFVGISFGTVIVWIAIVFLIIGKAKKVFDAGAGFESTEKKIKRTKVTYYPTCPGCGAPRGENEEKCSYCGRSLIESEEVIEETDEEAKKFEKDGVYHYGSNPNTFVRVHVVPIVRTGGSSGSHSSRGGGCAHSSCACASCACACACACAGGGRAGCTTKDFYNTDLKLTSLELKRKYRKKIH